MLQKSFYNLLSVREKSDLSETVRKFSALVEIIPTHPVFAGHFPGNPVVPGVCQIEIIREILMEILKKSVMIKKSGNIKFLSMINPLAHPVLDIDLDMKTLSMEETEVTALIRSGMIIFLKFRGTVQTESNG